MDPSVWKFKGLRPASFPPKKIREFAQLCSKNHFFSVHDLTPSELNNLLNELPFSAQTKISILINALIPILWWNSKRFQDEKLQEECLQLLKKIPAEQNSIIQSWKKMGATIKSSFETQGLLELKNELCNKKKCLFCKVGQGVLQT
jgi:hypothetical protein